MNRERLIEIYNVAKSSTKEAIDEWKRVNGIKTPTFRLSEVELKSIDDYDKAKKNFFDDVNRLSIRRTMSDDDTRWVLEESVKHLTKEQKMHLWSKVMNELKGEPAKEVNVFKSMEYDIMLTTEENVKNYKRWKNRIIREMKKAS